jgi:protease-4
MIAFLRWAGSIVTGTLNGLLMFALAIVLIMVAFMVVGLAQGDGLPGNIILSLDLRKPLADSAPAEFMFGARPITVMGIVLGLDAAERDARVKGVFLRVGGANLPIAQAEEIGTALKRFRASGKFVIAHAQDFEDAGLGDYLAAASASQIWMQPKSTFGAAGEGGGEVFLRGLLDKIQAEPQIVKRADYKSAADTFMEKGMTAADREQITALMQSWYDNAIAGAAADRKLDTKALIAVLEASPQFTEEVKKAGLIDKIGYDDDAFNAAQALAGAKAQPDAARYRQPPCGAGRGGRRNRRRIGRRGYVRRRLRHRGRRHGARHPPGHQGQGRQGDHSARRFARRLGNGVRSNP